MVRTRLRAMVREPPDKAVCGDERERTDEALRLTRERRVVGQMNAGEADRLRTGIEKFDPIVAVALGHAEDLLPDAQSRDAGADFGYRAGGIDAGEEPGHQLPVGHVAMDKGIEWIAVKTVKVFGVAGVSQEVQVEDVPVRLLFPQEVEEIGSDKPGSARHKIGNIKE